MAQNFDINTVSVQMTVAPTTVTTVLDPESYDKGYNAGETDGHVAGKAEGYTEGYDKGKSDGYGEGWDVGEKAGYQSGKSDGYAEGYTKGDNDGYTAGHADGYDEGIEAGKQAEYDAFWDAFQRAGIDTTASTFAGRGWNADNFKPKNNIVTKDGYMYFYNNGVEGDLSQILENLGVEFDTSELTSAQYMFWNSRFTRVPTLDFRRLTSETHTLDAFRSSTLKTIDKLIVSETTPFGSNMCRNATILANITFEGVIGSSINFQWSPLTKESITNIVEHLSSTATGQTCTFKKSAKEAAFTADEWAALIADKTNWTISLI